MDCVQDIDRPDVGKVAKMAGVADLVRVVLDGLVPELSVKADDNFCSSVSVSGSLDPRENWANGIFQNSRYFRFSITAAKGARYYDGGPVCAELNCSGCGMPKFRKYTGPVDKVAKKLAAYLGF